MRRTCLDLVIGQESRVLPDLQYGQNARTVSEVKHTVD